MSFWGHLGAKKQFSSKKNITGGSPFQSKMKFLMTQRKKACEFDSGIRVNRIYIVWRPIEFKFSPSSMNERWYTGILTIFWQAASNLPRKNLISVLFLIERKIFSPSISYVGISSSNRWIMFSRSLFIHILIAEWIEYEIRKDITAKGIWRS